MDKKEPNILELLNLNYNEICNFLKEKYGKVPRDYFTPKFRYRRKIWRTDEGLEIHHIDENKVANLSHIEVAKQNSFEYQRADRLVYCDLLEHLLLHFKIAEESSSLNLGIRGALNQMIPILNDIYSGIIYANTSNKIWSIREKIINYENEYFKILQKYFKFVLEKYPFEEYFVKARKFFELKSWDYEYEDYDGYDYNYEWYDSPSKYTYLIRDERDNKYNRRNYIIDKIFKEVSPTLTDNQLKNLNNYIIKLKNEQKT